MPAPVGNRFWEARSSHGRGLIFESPDVLWSSCVEYFDWVEEHPLYESKAFHSSGQVITANLPKMRAMTIAGLCNFLDISEDCWSDYRKREDFSGVVTRVEQVIRQQKFEGASADLLNANIIARDLGLAERNEHTGKDGGAIKQEVSVKDMLTAALDAKSNRQTSRPPES